MPAPTNLVSWKESMRTINCTSCGREASAPNQLTKYCTTCRLGRQAKWHKGLPSRCIQCKRQYIAWYGPKDWPFCGEHVAGPGRDSVKGACSSCKTKDVDLYNKDVTLCYPCLTDVGKYQAVREYILRKLDEVTR